MKSMGDEASWDPKIGELLDSRWLNEANKEQTTNFPWTLNNVSNWKHFYFVGQDVKVEILAQGFEWITIANLPSF